MSKLYSKQDKLFTAQAGSTFLNMADAPTHDTVDAIAAFMNDHAKFITASQLRNIYARLRHSIGNPEAALQQLPLVRVKLAYIKGKSDRRSRGFHNLIDTLDGMIREIGQIKPEQAQAKLKSLTTFFEAILAYHKYYEK